MKPTAKTITDNELRAVRDLARAMKAVDVARDCDEALQRNPSYTFLCDPAAAKGRIVEVIAALETAHARIAKGPKP